MTKEIDSELFVAKKKFESLNTIPTTNAIINELPRLNSDPNSLIEWIKSNGGKFEVDIIQSTNGWSLHTNKSYKKNDIIISIPKKLCLYSNPNKMLTKILPQTANLMNTLKPTQWRARLAILLLSERVRTNSFYQTYIDNLPFEFWGVPLFYNANEFK